MNQYVIEMYQTGKYDNFKQAKAEGGVYKTPVFWAEGDPKLTKGIAGVLTMSILESCRMMDCGFSVALRLRKFGGRTALDTLEVYEGVFTRAVRFY